MNKRKLFILSLKILSLISILYFSMAIGLVCGIILGPMIIFKNINPFDIFNYNSNNNNDFYYNNEDLNLIVNENTNKEE
jgi:hypothetical protein